jgi:metallo-beta-lactamase family protein
MAKLSFHGAASTVTGSCFSLTGESTHLLIDFGLFQEDAHTEELNHDLPNTDLSHVDAVLITHAHLDHCGRLPMLAKSGFQGVIYMTPATLDIAGISLTDSAKIGERKQEEENIPALYTQEDVDTVLSWVKTVDYGQTFTCGEYSIVYRDAGHILGSATIEVADKKGEIVVFSGDLGNSPEDLVEPTTRITKAQTVVMESTYGGETHTTEDIYEVLTHEIHEIEATRGVLLIPAFSIERTQEIIHRIGHLKRQNRISPSTQIFVDSPMAIAVTEIFKKYPDLYNAELAKDTEPFEFDNLTCTAKAEESKAILHVDAPKVIIAGSGMMNGGRIHFHLKNYLALHNTRLLIVGYQAEGTLGRKLLEGAKRIVLFDDEIAVHATITKIGSMSSHADEPKLLAWLKDIENVKTVFLVHGEDDRRALLAKKIKTEIPSVTVTLPTREFSAELT